MSRSRLALTVALAAIALAVAGCEKSQLLAPTKSSISLNSGTRLLPPGGSTEVTAVVTEEAGSPVQNGTTVRFSTTLGRVDPVESQTRNGIAVSTFFAGTDSGVAHVRAISGAASGGTTNTNQLDITIGAAAVNTVTLRASPGSVGPQGGTVELVATVVGENGQAVQGILVSFNTDQGALASTTATTDGNGQARTSLTTTQKATVSATAGTKTSSTVTVDLRSGPLVSISCTPASGSGNCAAVQAAVSNNTATVLFTAKKVSGSSTLRTSTLDFGDGTSQALGNLAGDATITHTYTGPSGSTSVAYTATVQATDINGEAGSASTIVIITPKSAVTPINVTISAGTPGTATVSGQRGEFTATVAGGGETGSGDATIQSYEWDFGDDESATTSGKTTAHIYTTTTTQKQRTVKVTVKAADGRTATGRTEILVDKFP
ncbi:MAG: Ig-like domain-containing protein [Acidobacteria bacterium]|nr:Ig-like domain-containing protein [Acidobacteriota bacterium]